ncbi:MAG: ChaN family lipoprotein [Bdellovibrionales bacterium]|nr:ChaN family lipoprotein [Bdellovibrionales bacterium]
MGLFLLSMFTFLHTHAAEVIWDTRAARGYTVEEFARLHAPGTVLVFGEQHATSESENDPAVIEHHANQVRLLRALTAQALLTNTHLSVGMEFLKYTVQDLTDLYVRGAMDEASFLRAAGWPKGNPFTLYREQILISRQSGGRTLALNAPPELSRQVARGGPESLSPEQRTLLPPLWERGSSEYFERFQEAMGSGHIAPEALERYFWAQSLWDDTMAWNIVKGLRADPLAVQVVIAGEFHVEFGHGLAARVHTHGASDVRTLLQVQAADLSDQEIARVTSPDPRYGARADFLWIQAP